MFGDLKGNNSKFYGCFITVPKSSKHHLYFRARTINVRSTQPKRNNISFKMDVSNNTLADPKKASLRFYTGHAMKT